MRVLLEDNHLLAVAKPAGIATMGAAVGEPSLAETARAYLKHKYRKPGEVYLGVVSRLDAPVTGIVLFARTSKAAGRLSAAFRDRQTQKLYAALVAGDAPDRDEPVVHHLRKDERAQRVHVTSSGADDAQLAELSYRVAGRQRGGETSLLLVRLHTGRKHQIRVQLAKLGLPILGDEKYGGPPGYKPGIALHAWRLALEHPVRREPVRIEAPLPKPLLARVEDARRRLSEAAKEASW